MMKQLVLKTAFLILLSQFAFAQATKKSKESSVTKSIAEIQARYWYFPNLEAYFDTRERVYMYMQDGEWQTAEEIPAGYRGYSFYNNVSITINDYNGDDVVQFLSKHKKKYPYIHNERTLKLITQMD